MYSSTTVTNTPYYGMPIARPADGPYGAHPPARPVSRSSSHTPTPMLPKPISRNPSPAPPGMVRPTDIRRSASADFQIEKAPKSPGPYGRPSVPQREDYNRNEQMFRQQVTALIAATGQQIIASGRVLVGPTPLVLFFRTKVGFFFFHIFFFWQIIYLIIRDQNGVSHCLDFPVDTGYSNPPSLDVLIAACKSHPKADFSNYGDRGALFFPENLSYTPSFEIANHLILGSVHAALYPQLPLGNHVFAVRNRLDVINSGSHLANHNPALLSNDGRSATIIVTLPVRFRGGDLVVRDSRGHEERYQRLGEQAGNLDWLAFPADCEYRIETVQKGCCLTLSYGVYLKHFNPSAGAISDALIIPSDGFFDLLAPILNMSRGRSIALYLSYDYIANPAEAIANSIVPQVCFIIIIP